ncbi:MAG: PqqD family protein [Geitlerinemataceae cyanobacterium]
MISQSSIIVAVQEQVSSEIAEESVILNLKSGVYYGLNAVGAWIWNRIQEPKTFGWLSEEIASEYEIDPDRCERDLLALLQDLVAAQLIEVK